MKIIAYALALTAFLSMAQTNERTRFEKISDYPYGLPTFFNKNDGWASAGSSGLRVTRDGGVTWRPVPLPKPANMDEPSINGLFFVSKLELWLVLEPRHADHPGHGGTLYRTFDAGATWQEDQLPREDWWHQTGLASYSRGSAVWFGGEKGLASPPRPGQTNRTGHVVFACEATIFHRATQGGPWIRQTLPTLKGCEVWLIRFFDNKRGLAVTDSTIYFTEDAGAHWAESEVKMRRPAPLWRDVEPERPETLQFLEGDERIGWLGFEEGDVYKTTDGGKHWRQIVERGQYSVGLGGFGQWGAVYFATEKTGWLLDGGHVFETRDGGEHWSRLQGPKRITTLTGAGGTCWVSGEDALYRLAWR
ncbi:WD40/YVTN/BNR-like repeat-containing protein [Paludibaculum fermentans]|uniref:WD40/YVTN/BNR-like repeat-containing protein n=1 Tax=Paludibaculum fermentans TaxID=1473598 RepID=UPI003EB983F4